MSETKEQAFSLVRVLAEELSGDGPNLPSLPEVVTRVRNELAKPEFSVEELARVIASEPALVGSVLTMANSSAFARNGKETSDLKVAISRVGAGMVQSAAAAFALRQLRASAAFKRVEHLLAPEWQRSSRTAATCYLIAQATKALKPDEAMVVGLLHNVGRIYLYSRAPQFPALFADREELETLVAGWQANVGKAILESWKLPQDAAEAVARQEDDDIDPATRHRNEDEFRPAPIVDVLSAGVATSGFDEAPPIEVLTALTARSSYRRLGLGAAEVAKVIAEREATRQMLGLQ